MPFKTTRQLPPLVRKKLSPHQQEIFRSAFNSAWAEYASDPFDRREGHAFRIAYAAIRNEKKERT
jgi:cation transport regulator